MITFTSTIGHTETMKIIEQPRVSLDINSTDALRVPVGNNTPIGQFTDTNIIQFMVKSQKVSRDIYVTIPIIKNLKDMETEHGVH